MRNITSEADTSCGPFTTSASQSPEAPWSGQAPRNGPPIRTHLRPSVEMACPYPPHAAGARHLYEALIACRVPHGKSTIVKLNIWARNMSAVKPIGRTRFEDRPHGERSPNSLPLRPALRDGRPYPPDSILISRSNVASLP
jgi:hypothetical protein